jgi:hypothetical protein
MLESFGIPTYKNPKKEKKDRDYSEVCGYAGARLGGVQTWWHVGFRRPSG